MNAEPKIPLSEFNFSFRAQQKIDPALLTPSLWHGIFGNALRQRVCLVPDATECKTCMFLQQCDYPFLFEGVKPLNVKNLQSSPDIPSPHIFKTITEQIYYLLDKQQINVSIILIGEATKRLSVLIKAMSLAGENGIGKVRTPLKLMQVKQTNATLPLLILENDILKPPLSPQSPLIPAVPTAISLLFKTPYRAKETEFKISFFLMQIIRRVSSLQGFYTDQPLNTDFKQFKALTNNVEVEENIFRQQDSRYSARHQQKLDTSGFMGKITLKMEGIEALWPYLYLGQWLHVGKNASFGYGCYELLNIG